MNSRWRVRLDKVLGRPWLAWAVLCVSTGLFLGLWYVLSIDYAERANARFELRARVLHAELSERMLDYVRVLDGGAGLFEASDHVSRQEFHDYMRALRLEQTRPGLLGVGFTLMVDPAERARHEAQIRAEGFPDYSIHPPRQSNALNLTPSPL